jgi:hypothetical protein
MEPGGILWTGQGRAVPTTALQKGLPVMLKEVTAPVMPPADTTIPIVTVQEIGGPPIVENVAGPLIVKLLGAGEICAGALGAPRAERARTKPGATKLRFDMTNLRLRNDGLSVV